MMTSNNDNDISMSCRASRITSNETSRSVFSGNNNHNESTAFTTSLLPSLNEMIRMYPESFFGSTDSIPLAVVEPHQVLPISIHGNNRRERLLHVIEDALAGIVESDMMIVANQDDESNNQSLMTNVTKQ